MSATITAAYYWIGNWTVEKSNEGKTVSYRTFFHIWHWTYSLIYYYTRLLAKFLQRDDVAQGIWRQD